MRKEILFGAIVMVVLVVGVATAYVFFGEDALFSPKRIEPDKNLMDKTSPVTTQKIPEIKLFDSISKQARMEYIIQNGEDVTKAGSVEIVAIDDFTDMEKPRGEYKYYFRDKSGETFRIYFVDEPGLISGSELEIRGRKLKVDDTSEIVVLTYTKTEREVLDDNPNLGEQRTAVILVNWISNPAESITVEEAWDQVFNETNDSLNYWIREVSFNKTWLSGNVYGWYSVPYDGCNFVSNAIAAADSDIYYPDIDRLIIMALGGCGVSGFSTLGDTEIDTDDGQVTLSWNALIGPPFNNGVCAHEFGHGMGLRHANILSCGNETISDECMSLEYFDIFDTMGWAWYNQHFNAYYKEKIGWLESNNVQEITSPGTYVIEPLEVPGDGVKALKIPIGEGLYQGFDFYLEYRRPIGYDALVGDGFEGTIFDGVFVRLVRNLTWNGGNTHLLDILTGTPYIVIIRDGEPFYDIYNGLKISTLNVTDNYVEILVEESCGNGLVDPGEDCDTLNLSDTTCSDLGYLNGDNLSCDLECLFDTSECGIGVCGPGHYYLSNLSCSATFISDENDGSVIGAGLADTWDQVRHKEQGNVAEETWGLIWILNEYNPDPQKHSMVGRSSVPFNTSSIPDKAIITSAEIVLEKHSSIDNTHPDSDDFITIVPTTLENPPHLSDNDFDEFSTIDDPQELSNRIDISESSSTFVFPLNFNGLLNINTTGFSGFGLRLGYDLDSIVNDGEYTYLGIFLFATSDYYFPPKYLKMEVTYVNCIYAPIGECAKCPDFDGNGNVTFEDGVMMEDCIYFGNESACLPEYDLNGDGKFTIIGDVTCFADSFNRTVTGLSVCCEGCGNYIIESGEECDDGNVEDGDGCNSICQIE
ncbi:MAG: hypothetical protein KJ600_04750 [Nanoarchaeota archaeon]|nr:hypothetical protein [Nanoarchaeota archaeon]